MCCVTLGKHVHFIDLVLDFLSVKWGNNNTSFSVILAQWFLEGCGEGARGFCTLWSSSPLPVPSKTFGTVSQLSQLGKGAVAI